VKKGKIFMVLDPTVTDDISYDRFEFNIRDPGKFSFQLI
jgi:hypothetical protein